MQFFSTDLRIKVLLNSSWLCSKAEVKTNLNIVNLTILVAASDFKNSPVFSDLKIQACKSFMAFYGGYTGPG